MSTEDTIKAYIEKMSPDAIEYYNRYYKGLIEQIFEVRAKHNKPCTLEQAIHDSIGHENSMSFGFANVFFENYFVKSDEYQELLRKYGDEVTLSEVNNEN